MAVSVFDDLLQGMFKALEKEGTLYINENGGYFFPLVSKGMTETEVGEVEKWVLPGEDIRVKQWPNGTHWYAYVGSASVEYDGINKWYSEAAAKNAAILWAKANNVRIESSL